MSAELCSIVIILTQCVPCIDRGNLNSRLATNCTSIVSFRSPMVVSPDISLLNYAVYSHHIDTRLNPTQHVINKPRQHAQVEMQKVQTTQQRRDSTFMQRPTDNLWEAPPTLHSPSETPTSSGSTSWAMTTSCAFFCSISVVTVLMPDRTTSGRFVGTSSLPLTRCSARSTRRALRARAGSGRYLSIRRNSWLAAIARPPSDHASQSGKTHGSKLSAEFESR